MKQEHQVMIQRIIDMDKEARRVTNEALERRAGSARAVQEKKQEVTDTFISMARKRVDVIRTTEMQDAAEQLEQGNARREVIMQRMQEQYESSREDWVNAIVGRVVSGDDLT